MDHDRDSAVGCQLAGPSDDEFFHLLIEVTFPERKGIQGMKQLRDVVDTQFDQIAGNRIELAVSYKQPLEDKRTNGTRDRDGKRDLLHPRRLFGHHFILRSGRHIENLNDWKEQRSNRQYY